LVIVVDAVVETSYNFQRENQGMPIFLIRIFRVVEKSGWKISLVLLAFLFILGWILMAFFEPAQSEIVTPQVYWWWFLVTTTTVGYGDYAPASPGGRAIATIIMVSGIGAIGIVITQMASIGTSLRRRMMEGTVKLKEKDHIVILGYHPGKTENLIHEILADKNRVKRSIVLCFKQEQATENPLPDLVLPVRGKLTSKEVMENACVDKASRIVADGDDDNETLVIALTVCETNRHAHVVAAVDDMAESEEHLRKLNRGIECVPQEIVTMITQAIQDPGITDLYKKFLSNIEGHAGFRFDIPEGKGEWLYGKLLCHFKKSYNATLLALTDTHNYDAEIIENPPWEFEVRGGMSLFYIAPERLTAIDFQNVTA
jgi:voltage-gated potassium channel